MSRSPSWLSGCLILAAVAAVALVILLVVAGTAGMRGTRAGLALTQRVGLIEVRGTIGESRSFVEELERVREDPRIRALVVRVDSPGGDVAATQEMYAALLRYRERSGQPVVVSMGSLAASGGYYTACAAEHIMAEPGTLTGSIGVIFSFTDVSELMKKLGVRVDVVKSGAKKDFGAWWRGLSDEERAMCDGIVADVYEQFTETVATSRHLEPYRVRDLADGRIFTGRQALRVGLVDTLGYQTDAVRWAARLADLPSETPTLSKKAFDSDWLEILRRLSGQAALMLEETPRLEYRYR